MAEKEPGNATQCPGHTGLHTWACLAPYFSGKKEGRRHVTCYGIDNMSLVMVDNMSSSNSDFDHYYSGCKIKDIGFFFMCTKLVFQPTSPQKHT